MALPFDPLRISLGVLGDAEPVERWKRLARGSSKETVAEVYTVPFLILAANQPNNASPDSACQRDVHLLPAGLTCSPGRLELDVTEDAIAFKDDVESRCVDLGPEHLDPLPKPEPGFLQDLRNEDVLRELLVEAGIEEFLIGIDH